MVARNNGDDHTPRAGVNALRFRCPVSKHEIVSDFCADAHTLSMVRLFSVRLKCPDCGELHEFKMDDALELDQPVMRRVANPPAPVRSERSPRR